MQRLWAAVLSVWATIAIVAVLAWNSPALRAQPTQPAVTTVLVRGANGKSQLVAVPAALTGAPHATTHTSPPPAGG